MLNPSHLPSGTLAAPAVTVPDVDGDRVSDLVVLAIGETQVWFIFPYTVVPRLMLTPLDDEYASR